jgi:hypothetical protein
MSMVVLLLSVDAATLSLGPEAAGTLAELGVTFAAVMADREGAALILDGRGFDPDSSLRAALRAVTSEQAARTLRPLAQLSVAGA